eukprot:Nk52_evm29s207 gene=Nk52_evmTU29s207
MDANLIDEEAKRQFIEFLEDDFGENQYLEKVQKMIEREDTRLIVSINHLREWDAQRDLRDSSISKKLMSDPATYLNIFNIALREVVESLSPFYCEKAGNVECGLEGSFGANNVTPRTLHSSFIGQMVCVEGIVSKCNLVSSKVEKSVHYNKEEKKFIEKTFRDNLSLGGPPTMGNSSAYPRKENGVLLQSEYGLSEYIDSQTLHLQEMPERAPAGLLPRSVEVLLTKDLVDTAKPGDRLLVVGIYRTSAKTSQNSTDGIFRATVIANNVKHIGKDSFKTKITEGDIKNIRSLANGKRRNVFDILKGSVAPSIYGHEEMKGAILCLLLGGCEKNFENGTHIRGDINMLMIGDPSTAKSQLLRYVLGMAPLAIATTGRGSSGVGLTAAVTTDKETGERSLEAGAMVLADRGIVCIDEFDKMSDDDRVAIHEVMEQQTVTIAKAGIHTSLNARCSVLAAANPIYGQYDTNLDPMRNISMPDSLLSRFDLLFIVLDKADPEHDSNITEHVLRMHRYRKAGEADGTVVHTDVDNGPMIVENVNQEDDERDTPVWQKFDSKLHGKKQKGVNDKMLTQGFLKKYIRYCKAKVHPVLSPEASERICELYSELRSNAGVKTLPITARTLETFIRISTAMAKARLSNTISQDDVDNGYELVRFSLFKHPDQTKKKKKDDDDDDDDDDDENDDEADENINSNEKSAGSEKGNEEESGENEAASSSKKKSKRQATSPSQRKAKKAKIPETLTTEREKEIMRLLNACFEEAHTDNMDKTVINMHMEANDVSEAEMNLMYALMENSDKVYIAGNKVYRM